MTDLEIIREQLRENFAQPLSKPQCDSIVGAAERLAKRVEELEGEIAKEKSDKIDLMALLETITDAYPGIESWNAYKQIMNGMEAKC